jgi:acyl-CoA thioesterase FadM
MTSSPTDIAGKAVRETDSTVLLTPRYEGTNICTWIGFKHVNYLVEEAVLAHFRSAGVSARHLYEEYGVGLDLVELDTRVLTALHADDPARVTVRPVDGDGGGALRFRVGIEVEQQDGATIRAASSKVAVRLRRADDATDAPPVPGGLAGHVVDSLGAGEPVDVAVPPPGGTRLADGRGGSDDPVLAPLLADRNAFGWKWRIPYFYCHFSERLQLSGYLRQLEEVVDLFLADRGISIRDMLTDRQWIPVVPHSAITILGEALMEEDLYTVYTVDEVFKDFTYRSTMDCYVLRDGALRRMATGTITHGYARIRNRRDWSLVDFDDRVHRALAGRGCR